MGNFVVFFYVDEFNSDILNTIEGHFQGQNAILVSREKITLKYLLGVTRVLPIICALTRALMKKVSFEKKIVVVDYWTDFNQIF